MKRESFKSRLGFILVSAGCAIGIGNVWRFPYVTGQNGGGTVLPYISGMHGTSGAYDGACCRPSQQKKCCDELQGS